MSTELNHESEWRSQGTSPPKQTTVEVVCSRCQGTRWIPMPYIPLDDRGRQTGPPHDLRDPAGSYLCQRCRAVLAGGNAVDPAAHLTPTDAQRAAWATAAQRLRKPRQSPPAGRPLSVTGPAAPGDDLGGVLAQKLAVTRQKTRDRVRRHRARLKAVAR
jgi:hypothetical protein